MDFKKEVRFNLLVPYLYQYLYLTSSSSSIRKHFANQQQIIQQLPNLYCTATSYSASSPAPYAPLWILIMK